MLVRVGVLPRTMKGKELVVLGVLAGSCTEIGITAPAATSAAVMLALRLVALLTEVGRALPFHITTEVAVKPTPVTFSVKALPGAVVERGEIALMRKAAVEAP